MENKKHPKKDMTKQPVPNKGASQGDGSKSAGSKMFPNQQQPPKGDKK